jgi:hypothetical protein
MAPEIRRLGRLQFSATLSLRLDFAANVAFDSMSSKDRCYAVNVHRHDLCDDY